MPSHFLAIDAGTTTIRALVVDDDGTVRGKASTTAQMLHPQPGHAEQNPDTYWASVQTTIDAALDAAAIAPSDIAAIGIAAQRTCCMVWDRATCAPLTSLVSWQDLRGIARCQELQDAGYLTLPYAAACKLESILKSIPNASARAESGEIAWGSIDSYLAARLSGNTIHATDHSQACTTGYYDFESSKWHDSILSLQNLPQLLFPKLVDSSGVIGNTSKAEFGAIVPIASIMGDQQAAASAHGCTRIGEGKVTYGTSATANVCTGNTIAMAPGAYPLVLQHQSDESLYCVEAMVVTAGAFIDWLAAGMGLAPSASDIEALAVSVPSSAGVHVLPALQGLGSPHGDSTRTAAIHGITRGTTHAHIARASLEGIAYRVREALDAIYDGLEIPYPTTIHADGGATASETLMQIQANILGIPVEVMEPREATAYGAAILAGIGIGHWSHDDVRALRLVSKRYEPQGSDSERTSAFNAWREQFNLPLA